MRGLGSGDYGEFTFLDYVTVISFFIGLSFPGFWAFDELPYPDSGKDAEQGQKKGPGSMSLVRVKLVHVFRACTKRPSCGTMPPGKFPHPGLSRTSQNSEYGCFVPSRPGWAAGTQQMLCVSGAGSVQASAPRSRRCPRRI